MIKTNSWANKQYLCKKQSSLLSIKNLNLEKKNGIQRQKVRLSDDLVKILKKKKNMGKMSKLRGKGQNFKKKIVR